MKKTGLFLLFSCLMFVTYAQIDSASNREKKLFFASGYNYNFFNRDLYYYGNYKKFNSYFASLSYGVLLKEKCYLGLKIDAEYFNDVFVFPIGVQFSPVIFAEKKSTLFCDLSAGYGISGKLGNHELNTLYPCSLSAHFGAGFIYEHKISSRIGIFFKANYNSRVFKTYEFEKGMSSPLKINLWVSKYNLSNGIGLSMAF